MYYITVKTFFSAAHRLRNYNGNCENNHGHNWKVKVTAGFKSLNKNGMAFDFRKLKKMTEAILEKLDHKNLNKLEYFRENNPSSENIAKYIFEKVSAENVPVTSVKVFETDNYCATYSKEISDN
ncbi:MAG: 6-carboxytetrahydropterin synthase QueD [Elusimicrobiota bacterium]